MYQRQQQRQHLGGTSLNSPFFTSHAQPSTTTASSSSASPAVDVNYGYGGGPYTSSSSPSYYGNSYSDNHGGVATSSGTHYDGAKFKGGSNRSGVSYLFLLVWTLLLIMAAFGYMQWVALPKQHMEDVQVEEEEVEELQHQWKTKYHDLKEAHGHLQERYQNLEQTSRDAQRRLEEARGAELELNDVHLELTRNQQWALEWKEKALGLETSHQTLKSAIQEFSRRQVVQK